MKKIIILLCLIVNFSFAQQASFFRGSSEYYADAYKSKLSQYITLTKTQCDAIDTLFGMLQGRIQVGSITNTRTLLTGYRQASFLTVWGNANANAISLPPYNYVLDFFNSPTHASDGVAWNGTNQYGIIRANPTTFIKNQISYYSQTNTINTSGCDMANVDTTITRVQSLYTGYLNKNRTSQYDINIVCSTAVATFASGLFISNANHVIGNLSLYGRDTLLATAANSGSSFSNPAFLGITVGAAFLPGTGFIQFSTHKMAFCSIGDSFDTTTDIIQYSKIINYFMKKLGINAY